MTELDDIDRKLLRILQEDGRTPYAELGKAVGLAVSSVNERVRKLAERGVTTGVHVRVAPEALGLDLAIVFVGWSDPTVEPRFFEKIAGDRPRMPPRDGCVELPDEGAGQEHADAGGLSPASSSRSASSGRRR